MADVNLKHDAIFSFYTGGDGICAHFVCVSEVANRKLEDVKQNCKPAFSSTLVPIFCLYWLLQLRMLETVANLASSGRGCLLSSAICATCVFFVRFFFLVLLGWCVFMRVLVLFLNCKEIQLFCVSERKKKVCTLLHKLQRFF